MAMPIYAYECKDCGVRFDRRQSFNDEPIRVCPECEGTTHRLIQPAGVIFKGSGFYVTDNRGSSKSSASTTKGETSTTSEGKSESKSEGKSEAKAESKSEKSESKAAAKKSDD
jgi:putative FmdB family regulatory protein